MRVVELANFQRSRGGSFVPMLRAVLGEVRRRGWEAEAVFFEDARDSEWIQSLLDDGIVVHFAPRATARSRRARRRWLARELAGSSEPTVFHSHFTSWDVASLLSADRKRGDVVFWHVHTAISRNPIVIARGNVKFRVLGRGVEATFCPAPNIRDGIVKMGGRPDRVQFLPSALDTDLFPLLDAEERLEARRRLELPREATVLLHFGWHFHLKGSDIFLETLRRLIELDPDRTWIGESRGGGEETSGLAEKLGIADRVRILEPVENPATLFGSADVMLSSSREEGMAYAVLESLCSGTPVVATNIPGHAYIGEHVAACRIVEQDADALAQSVLETLRRSPEQAAAEAEAGREWLVENLNVSAIATQLADAYEEAINRRRSGAGR
jgi:glycosyltransferase involved in cell wall biosynthesis